MYIMFCIMIPAKRMLPKSRGRITEKHKSEKGAILRLELEIDSEVLSRFCG